MLNVLRLKTGAELVVFNGKGGEYRATVTNTARKNLTLGVGRFEDVSRESPLRTHLALGLSKGDRFDRAIQKATELGVTEITPLFTERTEVKLNQGRIEKKQQHWQQICIHACEQSGRTIIPSIHNPLKLDEFLGKENHSLKIILHTQSETVLSASPNPGSVSLLVGPEGGFSEEEIQRSCAAGYIQHNLGPRVLRTETAPVAALGLIQSLWGDVN
jgi:16S rRNA (uracil1498-N3)-methyltransferase